MDIPTNTFWELSYLQADDPVYNTQIFDVYIVEQCHRLYLRGTVMVHQDCTWVESVDRDDFFLTKPVQMGLLLRIHEYITRLPDEFASDGRITEIDLKKWLAKAYKDDGNDGEERVLSLLMMALNTFAW